MTLLRIRSAWLTSAVALFASVCLIQPTPARADYKLTILHVNDMLSRFEPVTKDGTPCPIDQRYGATCFGGVPRLAASIKAQRATGANTVLLDAGGEFTGTPLWDQLKNRAVSTFMTKLQFDAMTVGFPEFNDGSPVLGQFIKEVRFPLLSSNINVERDPVLVDQIWPFVVMDKGNERIGIVGYSSEDIRQRAHPSLETRIDTIESTVKFSVRMIKSMGVTKIIAVSHAGYERDKEIARDIDGISVIVGGNSHTLLANKIKGADGPYPSVIKGPTGKPVLIVQAGAYGEYLGKLDVVYDNKGTLKSWKGEPILLDNSIAEDSDMRQAIEVLEATGSQAADTSTKPADPLVR